MASSIAATTPVQSITTSQPRRRSSSSAFVTAAEQPSSLAVSSLVGLRSIIDRVAAPARLASSRFISPIVVSRFKVARLLDQARATGLVRIELDYPGEINLDLSVRLSRAYGLLHRVVIGGPDYDDDLLRTNLGQAAAGLLTEIVDAKDVLGLA